MTYYYYYYHYYYWHGWHYSLILSQCIKGVHLNVQTTVLLHMERSFSFRYISSQGKNVSKCMILLVKILRGYLQIN